MNVKLSITVPVEDVPSKVAEFLTSNADLLDRFSKELENAAGKIKDKEDLLASLENLDAIRKKIFIVDSSLEDCYSILKGYVNYQYKLQEEKQVKEDESLQTGTNN